VLGCENWSGGLCAVEGRIPFIEQGIELVFAGSSGIDRSLELRLRDTVVLADRLKGGRGLQRLLRLRGVLD
jgi:hypothetical protein